MKSILVFIDGTICDERQRYSHLGKPSFYTREWVLNDEAVPGSVECLQGFSTKFKLIYIGSRPDSVTSATKEWLNLKGFPTGPVFLAETQADRLRIVGEIKNEYDFIAGIGDRWGDNELHTKVGCLSIILKENEGDWNHVPEKIETYRRKSTLARNQRFVEGKVEGLARVCQLLLKKYGETLWDTYQSAVCDLAESTHEDRRKEDLESFQSHGLDPANLKDMAAWYKLVDEDNSESEPLFGLQDREIIESTPTRYVEKVTRCYLAELWKKHGMPEVGYQIHCRTDAAWWDHPAWNPDIRFEQPQTLMQGHDACIFIQYIPKDGEV